MTSTIKVNNIQNQCGQNIINENSNTITIGASGDTIALASGASQSGFGRSGSVNWQTSSIKTATFTAASGEGYFCNTTAGAFNLTLPSSPSAGDIVALKDYAETFATNALTLDRNGSNINGQAANFPITTAGVAITLVYVDGTKGWLITGDGGNDSLTLFVAASGGNSTVTCGNFKSHIFTGPGTFTVTCGGNASGSNTVDYFVVAGGGGGGSGVSPDGGSGGGGGGCRLSNTTSMPCATTSPLASGTALPVTAQAYPIAVGAGGTAGNSPTASGQGGTSSFSTISSAGGGGGGNGNNVPGLGGDGGSGGGSHQQPAGGNGNVPSVSPPQGNSGGTGTGPGGSGGGGAGAAGDPSGSGTGGSDGGDGSFVISAGFAGCNGGSGPVPATRYFSGGGAGSNSPARGPAGPAGSGGHGGGGDQQQAGVANSGGGGGATSSGTGNAGGSGIVIIRYRYQ